MRDARSGEVLLAHRPDEVHSTASIGKLLLLVAAERGLQDGVLTAVEPLDRTAVERVADSGLWQHLRQDVLPLADVALLVAAVSDNLATNVLLQRVGAEAVTAVARDLGLRHTALHDAVRNRREPHHPPTLSTGTAAELAGLMSVLPPQVVRWLAAGTDLSMVASAFGLDPLAHVDADRGLLLVNKTGTDSRIRADVGLVRTPARALTYAVLAEWPPEHDARDGVLAGMRALGELLRGTLQPC